MDFECSYERRRWTGRIDRFERSGDIFYARLSGQDSGIEVICGLDPVGIRFICLPDHDAGCRIAPLTNALWNKERLTPLIGDADAVTVANGLRFISKLL